jgi:trigger factor
MKISVKNLSDTRVELTISVDAEELAIAEQVATNKLARDVKVPGFRKGKTPVAVAAKNIDPAALHEETLNNAISKSVAEAFTEKGLRALDRPAVEVKKMVPGEMLEFTAEVDILPTVKLGNYKKLKATVEKIRVADSEVDEIIERVCKGFAEKKDVDRAAKMGDETVINFIGKKDGVAFDGGTGNDYPLTLGSGQFIPGFEEGIVGHKTGDTFDLDLTFPADYGSAELKGAKVTFTTTLVAVKEVATPELTDELAAKAGPFKTAADLKADIKRELTVQKERESSDKLKDSLVSQLIKSSHVPVPEILIADQTESIKKDFTNNLMYRGLSLAQYLENKGFESEKKWIETEVKDAAIKRVQAGLVLAELSKAEKIEATSAELDARIETYRQQYSKSPEALKQFEQPEIRQEVANQLLTEKAVERLVELNK